MSGGDYGLSLDRTLAVASLLAAVLILVLRPPRFVPVVPELIAGLHLAFMVTVIVAPSKARSHTMAAAAGFLFWALLGIAYLGIGQQEAAVALGLAAVLSTAYHVAAVRRLAFFNQAAAHQSRSR